MSNHSIIATEKTGVLPGSTLHSSSSGPLPQQRVTQQDGDHISRPAKIDASGKPSTIPRGNGQTSVKKNNEKPEKSRFSKVMDGFWSPEGWLSLIAVSIAASVFVSLIFYLIQNSNSNSSNTSAKH
jgi:hypothetical protein